jgi:hypothetical protein
MRIVWATHCELRNIEDDEDVIVWVDVTKADALWRRDSFYIPRGAPDHRGKYERFGQWLAHARCPVEMAHVSVGDGNSLSFSNGRHRFAWVRDHGANAVPVTIWRGQARRLAKLAGTNFHLCDVGSAAG